MQWHVRRSWRISPSQSLRRRVWYVITESVTCDYVLAVPFAMCVLSSVEGDLPLVKWECKLRPRPLVFMCAAELMNRVVECCTDHCQVPARRSGNFHQHCPPRHLPSQQTQCVCVGELLVCPLFVDCCLKAPGAKETGSHNFADHRTPKDKQLPKNTKRPGWEK